MKLDQPPDEPDKWKDLRDSKVEDINEFGFKEGNLAKNIELGFREDSSYSEEDYILTL